MEKTKAQMEKSKAQADKTRIDKNSDNKNNENIKDTENKAKIKEENDSKGSIDEKETSASDLSFDMSTLKINKQTIDLLIANVIPTTKYFESRFDHMQFQIDRINRDINEFKTSVSRSFDKVDYQFEAMQASMDQRFEAMQASMDQRFEKVDQRFEKVDQRFEQMDQRFQHLEDKIDKLIERIDVKVDSGLKENRSMTVRLFTFALSFSLVAVVGMFGKLFGLF